MTKECFRFGFQVRLWALISLGITVFSTISTIIPVLINTDDISRDNNLNHELFRLSHTLNISLAVSDFDNFENVSNAYKKNIAEIVESSENAIGSKNLTDAKTVNESNYETYFNQYIALNGTIVKTYLKLIATIKQRIK